MQATTVRVSPATREALASLARVTDSSLQGVLDAAVEAYRRQIFLERTNQAFSELRKNPAAWAEYQQDIASWETTGTDGA